MTTSLVEFVAIAPGVVKTAATSVATIAEVDEGDCSGGES